MEEGMVDIIISKGMDRFTMPLTLELLLFGIVEVDYKVLEDILSIEFVQTTIVLE